jgi:indolepyruvate ferredoxin oxidoreductase alpha subunit
MGKENAKLTICSDAPGQKLFLMGNEAIARGALEAGVQVAAAYPGTPSSEIVETLAKVGGAMGMYVEWSTNEKVAFETALAASVCGVRAMASMKHVGVNVALDSVMTAGYIGAIGGLVLISADDPSAWSSQGEQDNRYIAKQAYLPVLEPSSTQEAKDMMVDAFYLSETYNQPFMVRPVTRVAHGRGDVLLGPISKEKRQGVFQKNPTRFVAQPSTVKINRPLMIQRLVKIQAAVNDLRYNHLTLAKKRALSIIASGISYCYAVEALRWLGIEESVSVLKIGTPYPLPVDLVVKLLAASKTVLVVEELEPIVEMGVKAIAQEHGLRNTIHGKDLVPLAGELSVDVVTEVIAKMTGMDSPSIINKARLRQKEVLPLLPERPPTLCAGCPHRASLYNINVAAKKVSCELGEGVVPVYAGDIGCYGLGYRPPLNSKDISISMGSSFGLASGMAHVLNVPIIAHMGDSTFFHSGISPMVNIIFNRARVTMVVLDNSTTSMTGFQPNPTSGITAMGDISSKIRPEAIALACGIEFVEVVDPFDTEKAIDTLERAMRFDGPSFVVLKRTCAVLEQKEQPGKVLPFHVNKEKCLDRVPPCQTTCPLHLDVKGYVGLIREGKFDEALERAREKLPFPGILGRVCTRPCERSCPRGQVDDPLAIAALHRSAADHGNIRGDELSVEERPEKVAIIGGGPAGIMAAYDLRAKGFQVTIFEALLVLGGMLAVGVPEYRLPRDILEKETGVIERMGVGIKYNTRIGVDISLADLRKVYDAIFIAVGAHQSVGLSLEGGMQNVVDGVTFLKKANTGEKVDVADRVVVIGGGMVAVDCARVLLRLGAKKVELIYRRSRAEMPAIPEEVDEAEKEGVAIRFLAAPHEVKMQEGRITGIVCRNMTLGEPDASGRRQPVPIADSEYVVETDMIISAIGAHPDLAFLADSERETVVKKNLLDVNPTTMETRLPGIFGGGDAVTGPATVIEALAAGRKAAVSIDRYLAGAALDQQIGVEEPLRAVTAMDLTGVRTASRVAMPTVAPERRIDKCQEVELGFNTREAIEEAERCLSCECKTCINMLGCPAIVLDEGQVTIDEQKCPGCGVCAQMCPGKAVTQGV